MRVVPEIEHKIKRAIRDGRAKDPLVSVVALQEQLEKKFNRTFSRAYIAKLATKVEGQALAEADRTKIENRIAFTRENYRMMRERLLQIVYWNPDEHPGQRPPLNKDINEACKNVVMMDLALLSAEVAAGMYRNKDEATASLRYAPMPEERRLLVVHHLITWGALPKEQAERIVPALPASNGATATADAA